MGEFGELSNLLEEARKESNTVGKVWLTVLFVFRIFVLVIAAKEVWGDEQSNFLCDTNQPGCQLACYDNTFPVSHLRFWIMQILIVSTPTLIYLGYVLHQTENKERSTSEGQPLQTPKKDLDCKIKWQLESENLKIYLYKENPIPLDGKALKVKVCSIVSTILLEVAFLIAQYFLYGFGLESMYPCERWPCLTKVFCYVSRPTEKTMFIIFMLIVALVSLLLNIVEMFFIHHKKKLKTKLGPQQQSCKSTKTSRTGKNASGTYI